MKMLKTIMILSAVCLFYYGCGDFVSEKDIKRAIFTVMRGFESSTRDKDPDVFQEYENAADITLSVDDGAVVNDLSLLVRDDRSMELSGTCVLSGYEDPYSGYGVDGELIYSCERSTEEITYCDFECEAVLSGGSVKTLEFSIEMDDSGEIAVASIVANGSEVTLNKWDSILDLVHTFNPGERAE